MTYESHKRCIGRACARRCSTHTPAPVCRFHQDAWNSFEYFEMSVSLQDPGFLNLPIFDQLLIKYLLSHFDELLLPQFANWVSSSIPHLPSVSAVTSFAVFPFRIIFSQAHIVEWSLSKVNCYFVLYLKNWDSLWLAAERHCRAVNTLASYSEGPGLNLGRSPAILTVIYRGFSQIL
jgi:hypothetical protein